MENLELAKLAVRSARDVLVSRGNSINVIESTIGREWKIKADRYAEEVIIEILQKESNYPIISEECGELFGVGPYRWVIDPIDGSANYFRGIPLNCISVSLWENKTPVLGVTLDISRNDLVWGTVEGGAWCNDQSIQVSNVSDSTGAILGSGFPVGFDWTKESLAEATVLYSRFGKIRMLGSAALMMTWVARGLLDCYWERRIAIWDIGAGAALVEAAGGIIRFREFTPDNRVDVIAACNPKILAAVIDGTES